MAVEESQEALNLLEEFANSCAVTLVWKLLWVQATVPPWPSLHPCMSDVGFQFENVYGSQIMAVADRVPWAVE